MDRHLNLIKKDFAKQEKRRLPRFPFCFLTFKSSISTDRHVFEVKDISNGGMQLELKNGVHTFRKNDDLEGEVHWLGNTVLVKGIIQWVTQAHVGVSFTKDENLETKINNFLGIEQLVKNMRPLHTDECRIVETPANLKYWLRGDGPMEIFVWQHSDSEFSKIQMVFMENFIEWEDGKGTKTGRALSKRDVDGAFLTEDEFVFQIDEGINDKRIEFCSQILSKIPDDKLGQNVRDFIRLKLGISS